MTEQLTDIDITDLETIDGGGSLVGSALIGEGTALACYFGGGFAAGPLGFGGCFAVGVLAGAVALAS